jgi:hypothetical protein
MVFIATFNNISVISWRSVLLVEEIRVSGENHRPIASHVANYNFPGSSNEDLPFKKGDLITIIQPTRVRLKHYFFYYD